jgi:hypothetical protein
MKQGSRSSPGELFVSASFSTKVLRIDLVGVGEGSTVARQRTDVTKTLRPKLDEIFGPSGTMAWRLRAFKSTESVTDAMLRIETASALAHGEQNIEQPGSDRQSTSVNPEN